MATKILARRGPVSGLPTLDSGEFGYAIDTKQLAIGDGTSTPPLVMTTKTTALMDYTLAAGVKYKAVHATKGDSSVADVSLVIGANVNTGLYSPGAGQIALAAAGVNVFTATATAFTVGRNLTVSSTGFLKVATGTTAQRLVGAVGGEIRFNTSIGSFGALEVAGTDGNWFTVLTSAPNDPWAVNTGTDNAIVATLSTNPAALTAGLVARVKVSAANTAAATLNINGLGAKTIVKPDCTPLGGNELVTGMIAEFIYDPTLDSFHLTNPFAADSAGGGGSGEESPLYATFVTRTAILAGDVMALYANGTVGPVSPTQRLSFANPLSLAKSKSYEFLRNIVLPNQQELGGPYNAPTNASTSLYATLNNGNFVVLDFKVTGANRHPRAHVYAPSGSLIRSIFLGAMSSASGEAESEQISTPLAVVALTGGGFAVAWSLTTGVPANYPLQYPRFAIFGSDGTQIVGETRIGAAAIPTNATIAAPQIVMGMVALASGGFGVAWMHRKSTGSVEPRFIDFYASTYSAVGVQIGSDVLLATNASGSNLVSPADRDDTGMYNRATRSIALCLLNNGNWSVAWLQEEGGTGRFGALRVSVLNSTTGAVVDSNRGINVPTAHSLMMVADTTAAQFYVITAGSGNNNVDVVIHKCVNAHNVAIEAVGVPCVTGMLYAAIPKAGGGITVVGRFYDVAAFDGAGRPEVTAKTFSTTLTLTATKVYDGVSAFTSGVYARPAFAKNADGSYNLLLQHTGAAGLLVLDSNLNLVRFVLNLVNTGEASGFFYPFAISPNYAHPDDSSVMCFNVLAFRDRITPRHMLLSTFVVAQEARAIVGIATTGADLAANLVVQLRGPAVLREDWGTGLTFDHRRAALGIAGTQGFFLGKTASLGGPVKYGAPSRVAVSAELTGPNYNPRSYTVPQGYVLDATCSLVSNGNLLLINGVAAAQGGGGEQMVKIAANAGDILSNGSSGSMYINGWLYSE